MILLLWCKAEICCYCQTLTMLVYVLILKLSVAAWAYGRDNFVAILKAAADDKWAQNTGVRKFWQFSHLACSWALCLSPGCPNSNPHINSVNFDCSMASYWGISVKSRVQNWSICSIQDDEDDGGLASDRAGYINSKLAKHVSFCLTSVLSW
jgi:hypothetical protein